MKRILSVIAGAGLLLMLHSCGSLHGSGPVKKEDRTVASFNNIDISAPVRANITVQEGSAISVSLSGYENLLQEIKTEVRNNTLHIYTPDGLRIDTDTALVAEIVVPSLASLELSGASDAYLKGKVTGNEFTVDVSGAGNIKAEDVSCNKFSADVSGSGDVEIKGGMVQDAEFSVSGAGSIAAFGLQSQSAAADVSGAGSIELTAMQQLNASVSGAGSIAYKGHPKLTEDRSGAGSVVDAN